MICIHSNHHRRGGSKCPVTGFDHGSAGKVEDSRWYMHQDSRQLSDEAAAELHPAMFALLGRLREKLPVAPLWIAIVRRDDIPIPLAVCSFDTDPAQCCHAIPQPREFEISYIVPGDCAPKTRCPRCLATMKEFVGVDSVLRSHLNTPPLEPISPPQPPPPMTTEEIEASKRQKAVDVVERILCATATSSRVLGAKQGAAMLVEVIESIIALSKGKETR